MSEETPAQETAETNIQAAQNNQLPQWARDELKSVRDEAASYRVKAKETAKSLETTTEELAGLKDQYAALEQKFQVAELASVKTQVALSNGIPGESVADFTELLVGSTAEEIAASAEKLAAHWQKPQSTPATDRSQGLGASGSANPADQFAAYIQSQLS